MLKANKKAPRQRSEHPFQVFLRGLSAEQREQLAKDCESSYDYLRKLCGNGGRKPSPEMAKRIEIACGFDKGLLLPEVWEPREKEPSAA